MSEPTASRTPEMPEDLRASWENLQHRTDELAVAPEDMRDLYKRVTDLTSKLAAMTADRNLWREAHDEDCPHKIALDAKDAMRLENEATIKDLQKEITQLKVDVAMTDLAYEAQAEKFDGCPHAHAVGEYALCGCSYDKPSDVCAFHAPQLRKAQAEIKDLQRRLNEAQAPVSDEDETYVAWLRYRHCHGGEVILDTCNSNDQGAFKVWRKGGIERILAARKARP